MAYKCGIQHAEEEKTEGFLKKKEKKKNYCDFIAQEYKCSL